MALSRRTGRSRFTLILLLLTSVTVITLDFRSESSGFIDDVREGALDAFAPVKDAADSAFAPVANAWNGIFNYDDLEEENARLKEQIEGMEGDQVEAEAISKEHAELLELQKMPFTQSIEKVDARVITEPVSNFELSFQIDAGRGDGIRKDMPVVAGKGLVGRVVRVAANQSVVQLVTDRDFAAGIRLVASNETALAEGQGRDSPLAGTLIDIKVPVRRGERVVTSGIVQSGKYPPGIPVGRVVDVERAEGGLEQRADIEPNVDVEHLTFVSVLLWNPPDMSTPWVKLPLVILAALVLQVSLLPDLRVFDVAADLMMLLPIAAALTGGPERGAAVGFVSGICYDLFLSTPFGMSALAFTLVGYGTGLVQRQVLRTTWWTPILTATLASAAGVVVYVLVGAGVGQTDFLRAEVGTIILVVGLFNGLLSVGVVPVMRWTFTTTSSERAYL